MKVGDEDLDSQSLEQVVGQSVAQNTDYPSRRNGSTNHRWRCYRPQALAITNKREFV
jgi:hypothetical protein